MIVGIDIVWSLLNCRLCTALTPADGFGVDSVTQTCQRVQHLSSSVPIASSIWLMHAVYPPSPLQTRRRSSRHPAYRARPRNHPAGPALSLCSLFPYLFARTRQSATAFAEVETALPSRLLGTSACPNRLLPPRRFPSHGIWPGQQRGRIAPARP